MSAEKVRGFLLERGVEYHTAGHQPAYTTAEIAEAGHIPGHGMAKPVMVMADGRLVMAVIPGDRRLDVERLGSVLGAEEVRLASEEEFAPAFPDCEVGAEPPFGSLYGVPMVVDDGFDGPTITFNAGTHTDTMTIAWEDYREVTRARLADLA